MHNKFQKVLSTKSVLSAFVLVSSCLQGATFSASNQEDNGPGSLKGVIFATNAIYPGVNWGNEIIFGSDLTFSNVYPVIRNNVSLNVLEGYTIDFASSLTSTKSFEKSGLGTMIVSAPLTFVGDWTVRNGTLSLQALSPVQGYYNLYSKLAFSNVAYLGDSSIRIYDNGALDIYQSSLIKNRIEVLGSGSVDVNDQNVTLAYLTQGGTLTKSGSGRLQVLNGKNFSGKLNVLEGELELHGPLSSGIVRAENSTVTIVSDIDTLNYQLGLKAAQVNLVAKNARFLKPLILEAGSSNVSLKGHVFNLSAGVIGDGELAFSGPGNVVMKEMQGAKGSFNFDRVHLFISDFAKNSFYKFQDTRVDLQASTTLDRTTEIDIGSYQIPLNPNGYEFSIYGQIKGSGAIVIEKPGTIAWHSNYPFEGSWLQQRGLLEASGTLGDVSIGKEATLVGRLKARNLDIRGALNTLDLDVENSISLNDTTILTAHIHSDNTQKKLRAKTIHLKGGLTILPEPGHYDARTIEIASGDLIEGSFDTFRAPAQFQGRMVQDSNTVNFQLDKFLALSELVDSSKLDDLAMAQGMDRILAVPDSDMDNVIRELLSLRDDPLLFASALDGFQPAYFSALGLVQESNFILDRSSLSNRMQELLSFPCALDYVRNKDAEVWFDPVGDFTRQKSRQNDMGYWGRTFGFFTGLDGKVTEALWLGGSAGFTHSRVEWKENVGRGFINSGYLSGYFLYNPNNFYMNGSLTGGYNHYEADRFINAGSVHRTAQHKNAGFGYSADLEFGYLIDFAGTFQPFLRQSYISLYQRKFTETGATSLDLAVKSKDFAMYRVEGGVLYNRCFDTEKVAFTPEVSLSAIYELELETGNFEATYVDSGASYEVTGMKPRRFLISPGVAIDTIFKSVPLMVGLRYHAELGTQFYDQRVSGHVGYSF